MSLMTPVRGDAVNGAMKTRAVQPEPSAFGCIRAIPLRPPDPRKRSAARPSRGGAVLACAVLLTGLFAAGSASAQTTIWEATLTPGEYTIGGVTNTGFIGVGSDLAGTLSDTDFVYDGTTYTIDEISRRHSNGQLDLTFAGCCTVLPDASSTWILESAGTQIALRDLESSPFLPSIHKVSGAPNWQDGQAVTVRIFNPGVPPSAVRNLTARAGNQRVHVTWDRPETIGDTGVYLRHYEYQRKVGSGPWSEWIESPAQTQQTTGFTLTGLDNGTVYSFRVRLINTQRFAGPDGDTVTATPIATYRLNHTHWGIRRGGKGTPVTLSVGGGPFRGRQTYTLHWNGNPVNQAPLHADNPTTMVLPAGQTQVTVQLRAAADADGADKVYDAEVQYPLVARQSGTEVVRTRQSGLYDGKLSVHDNEDKPAASLTASDKTVNEGDSITLTVTLGHRIDRAVTMPLKVTNPNKRPVTVPANITVPANQLSASVTVATTDTRDQDGDHTLTFFIDRDRDDPFLFGSNNVAVTVRDVTPAGTPTIKAITNSVDESGDTTRNAKLNFGVILSKPVNTIVTVTYHTADGSATAGTDYVEQIGALTFRPGEVRKDVSVEILEDGVGEPRETFRLVLSSWTGVAVLTQFNWALGIIYDRNPTFIVYDASAHESGDGTDTAMRFKVHLLNADDTATVRVDYATADGSARAGSDYTATSGRLTFRPGASSSQIVTVPVKDDAVEDSGETFSLRLSNPQGGAQLHVSDSTATGTILAPGPAVTSAALTSDPNDDGRDGDDGVYGIGDVIRATVTFNRPVTVDESGGTPFLTLEVGAGTVQARYESGSGTDRLVFAYTVAENDEDADGVAIAANGLKPDGGGIEDAQGADAVLTHAATPADAGHRVDGVRPVLLSAVRSPGGETLVLTFSEPIASVASTSFGLRNANEFHLPTPVEAVISGATVELTMPTTFDINLVGSIDIGLGGARDLAGNGNATTSLFAVSGADTTLNIADAQGTEGTDATIDFTVTLNAASTGAVTVDYATQDTGSATAGSDYTATSGTLTFNPGDTSMTLSVPIIDDTVNDSGETFEMVLSNAVGAAIADSTATGTILNTEILTGSFEHVPTEHDGSAAFTFNVAFSEDVGISYVTLRDESFSVTDGDVTGARRVDGRHDLWEITVEPESGEAVTVTLPGDRACGTIGTVCTRGEDPRPLRNSPSATVAGPAVDAAVTNTAATGAPTISGTPQVDETLTVSVSGIADADGLDHARYAYQWIRGGTDIEGATDASYTLVSADEGETITVRVSFTDDAENAESLTSAATDAVAAAPEPLTASFSGMPAEHAGEGTFSFGLTFSENVKLSYLTLRDAALSASGGAVRKAQRQQQGSNVGWDITVEPDSAGAVTIGLPGTTDCDAGSAICTADGRPLSHSLSATIAGPVGISVADARVEEAEGAQLAFVVTLSRAASGALTVDYATSDGSAQAGVDYTAASGTLTFRAGESSRTIEVAVLDDSHDDGGETLTLTLSNPSSGRLTDAGATGTIVNRDPLPRALLARFGRTAAVHVVEHVEERLQAPRDPGFRGWFAGRELRRGMERDFALGFLRQLGGAAGVNGPGAGTYGAMAGAPADGGASLGTPGRGVSGGMATATGPMGGAVEPGDEPTNGRGLLQLGLGGGDLLSGSAFSLTRETRHGGILSFWSRGAQSHFSGREGALSLGGDVRTTMIGADYATGPLVTGLSLSHSRGLGEYAGVTGGQVASAVTGLYPWLGYQATDRITVWGVAGYGAGGLLLTPEGGSALESGLSMAMAAAGTRGDLVAGGAGGFALAFKADALWVGTSIDGVDGAAGRLAATEAAVTRFRTGLEGSRDYTLAGRLSLRPSVEVGLRHDGGDAENGAGMDVGGGLVVSDASTGLAVDLRVRMLVMHQAEGFRERGMALSLSYNPTPSTPLGFTARVAPSWGGQATSGAEALWGQETMAGMARGGVADGTRLDAEVGYGLPVGSRFVGTPRVGVGTSADGRDYRLGYRLGALGGEGTAVELGVDAQRRERSLQGSTDHGVIARATVHW